MSRRHFRAIAGLVCGLGATISPAAQRGAPSQTTQAPPAPSTAAISGVVIDGSTGRPIQGAAVSIITGTDSVGPGRFITDSQGRFVFPRLRAGSYMLGTIKAGYFNARYGQTEPATSASRTVELADGQWFADARIVLWKPGAISGTITDEAGEPVVGAPVRALKHVMVAGQPQIAGGGVAKTDDRGRYRIAGMTRGQYVVMVPSVQASVPADTTLLTFSGYHPNVIKLNEDAGRELTMPDDPAIFVDALTRLVAGRYAGSLPADRGFVYPPTMFPSGRTMADAARIDLNFGEERSGVDIRLAPVRTVRVSGTLQGAPDAAAGMTLRLLSMGSETLGFGSETATALVAANGAFTFLNVPSGTYTLIGSRSTMEYGADALSAMRLLPTPPGWISGSSSMGGIESGSGGAGYSTHTSEVAGPAYSARITVTVGDQNLSGVVVPLRRAATVTGKIEWSGGAAMGMPSFDAVPANGDPSLGIARFEITPGEPRGFRATGLLAGPYVFRIIGPGTVKSIEWQGRDYLDRAFDASDGRDIDGVVVTLTTNVAEVNGSVRDARGQLASSGAVMVFPTDRSLWTGYGFRPLRLKSKAVATNGGFSISPLPAGDYYVIAVEDAQSTLWQDPKFLEAAAPQASKITVGWSETKTVNLSIKTVTVRR